MSLNGSQVNIASSMTQSQYITQPGCMDPLSIYSSSQTQSGVETFQRSGSKRIGGKFLHMRIMSVCIDHPEKGGKFFLSCV